MSLINQVLQDLDRRRAVQPARPLAACRVVPVTGPDPRRPPAKVATAALLVGAVAAAMLIWRQSEPGRPPPAAATMAQTIAETMPSQSASIVAIDFSELGKGELISPLAPPLPDAAGVRPALDGAEVRASFVTPGGTASAVAATAAPAVERADDNVRGSGLAPPPPSVGAALAAPVRVEKSTPPLSPAERAEVDYRRGLDLHGLSRGNDAEAAFAAALQQDGGHAPARRALALEWIDRGRLEEAARLLRDGLAQNGQTPQLAIVLARLQAQRDDLQGGISTLRTLLDASVSAPAEHAEARALMATFQQSAGQHREAIESYTAALRRAPQKGAWWVGLGLSLAADGRIASAVEAFERARATGTLSPELLLYVEQRLGTGFR